jgi:TPR repeat protein
VPANKVVATVLFESARSDFMSERSEPGRAAHTDQLKASLTTDEAKKADTLSADIETEWRNKNSITDELDYFLAHGRGKLRMGEVNDERTVTPKPSTSMKEPSAEDYYQSGYIDVAPKKYLERATKGDAVAENILGVFSLWAWGTKKDYAQALSWFKKSAGHGNLVAMSNLAYMYQQGLGVGVNLKQASYWYGKAADLHDKRAVALLPIVKEAIAQPGNAEGNQAISDLLLVGGIPSSCNERARDLLKMAELQIPAQTSKFDFGPNNPEEMSNRNGFAKEDFGVALINEYAWAGCFKDASRVLDSYQKYSPYFRDIALSGVVKALAHNRQYDRALALAYSVNDGNAQDRMLREITVGAALDGNYALAIDYANSLVKLDQFPAQYGFYYAMEALADKGDYVGLEKIGMSEKIRGKLGVDGNLLLAKALYRTNDRTGAVKALRDAQARLPEFAHRYLFNFDSPINHVSKIQALLEPEAVDTSMLSVTDKSNNYRIQVLLAAVHASTDRKWLLHWLDEIDQLSPAIVEGQKNLRDDDLTYVCDGAQAYAFLDMYQHAFDLLQQRGCGFNLGHQEQVSQDLGSLFRIAAVKNDIRSAIKLMPPELGKPEGHYKHHIFPLVYGLARAGRYSEALSYLRQVESRLGPGSHPKVEDLLADVGKIADKNFPVQDWIAEVNVNSAKLDLNRWDALRILFSICTRIRGYDAAKSLAKQFTGEDLASAEIGIAEGLRGFQLGKTQIDQNYYYLYY